MRILPNPQNNAVLIFATAQEEETVVAMLRKIDILPMQVRIDATIAEVTLNDNLQYGTQFFFKSGGINGMLNNASSAHRHRRRTPCSARRFPGFVIGGNGQGGAPFAISALQAVTTVNVLSSPQLMVVDNQPARLQVGALVPYLSGSRKAPGRQRAGGQLDRLPADRRDHGGHAAGQQRRAGDARHHARRSARSIRHADHLAASTARPSSSAA